MIEICRQAYKLWSHSKNAGYKFILAAELQLIAWKIYFQTDFGQKY